MKKIVKGLFAVCVAIVCVFAFTACTKTPLSATTVDTSKVLSGTNGGVTVVCDGYLYFINGTKTNDGTNSSKNTKSALCKVKYNEATGEIDEKTYSVVADDLVGYDFGSINVFGNFVYYTTPNSDVNYKDEVLFNKTDFMRYDIATGKTYCIYTTKLNSEDESLTYAYYVVGEELYLIVYEKASSTITSLKVGNETETIYTISDVKSCILSENYGKSMKNDVVDANNFVFYTKSNEIDGVDAYRVSPKTNNSKIINNDKEDISLLSIRNGKLLYSFDSKILAATISGTNNDYLDLEVENSISFVTQENCIFMENDDSSVTCLVYSGDTLNITGWDWTKSDPIIFERLFKLDIDDITFIDVVTLTDVEDDEETTDVDETELGLYLIYSNDSLVYKIKIADKDNATGELTYITQANPVKLSKTEIEDSDELLVPEVIGNYLYVFAKYTDEDDEETDDVYLHRIDLTVSDSKDAKDAEFVGIKE